MKEMLRGLRLNTNNMIWHKIENKQQLKWFQEDMFRTDKKNKKYNYKLNIMMDSGDKKLHEPMSYFGLSFDYSFMKRMDKLGEQNEYEFRVATLQQLFFEIIYPRFMDDIRFATITYGNVYRYKKSRYELVFEEPKLHVIFESVVDVSVCKIIEETFIDYLYQLGYKDDV